MKEGGKKSNQKRRKQQKTKTNKNKQQQRKKNKEDVLHQFTTTGVRSVYEEAYIHRRGLRGGGEGHDRQAGSVRHDPEHQGPRAPPDPGAAQGRLSRPHHRRRRQLLHRRHVHAHDRPLLAGHAHRARHPREAGPQPPPEVQDAGAAHERVPHHRGGGQQAA